jgi:hypothetical protein
MEDEFFVATRIDEHRSLSISSISRKTYLEAGAEFFPSDRGYFICEHDTRQPQAGLSVLAKVASLEAAYRLVELWRTVILEVIDARAT